MITDNCYNFSSSSDKYTPSELGDAELMRRLDEVSSTKPSIAKRAAVNGALLGSAGALFTKGNGKLKAGAIGAGIGASLGAADALMKRGRLKVKKALLEKEARKRGLIK